MKYLPFIILLFTSCNQSQPDTPPIKLPVSIEEKEKPTTPSFVKVFDGKIGDYPVMMKLQSDEGTVTGEYHYASKKEPLKLHGIIRNDHIELDEFDSAGRQSGLFMGNLANGKLSGTWALPDGSKELQFNLIETSQAYPASDQTDQVRKLKLVKASGASYLASISDEEGVYMKNELRVLDIDDKSFAFNITTVSKSGCTGEITEIAQYHSPSTATYDNEPNCHLAFYISHNSIEIIENEPNCEHGLGCSFAGVYHMAAGYEPE